MLLLSYAKSSCRFITAGKVGRVSCCAHLNPNLLRWCTPPGSELNLGSGADYAGAESCYMAWSKCKHCHIAAQREFLCLVLCVDQLLRAEPGRSGVWESPAVLSHAGLSPSPAQPGLIWQTRYASLDGSFRAVQKPREEIHNPSNHHLDPLRNMEIMSFLPRPFHCSFFQVEDGYGSQYRPTTHSP